MWMAPLTEGFCPFLAWVLSPGGDQRLGLWPTGNGPGLDWWLCYGIHLLSSCTVVVAFSFLSTMAFWSPAGAEEISSVAVSFTRQLKSFPLDGLHCWPTVC